MASHISVLGIHGSEQLQHVLNTLIESPESQTFKYQGLAPSYRLKTDDVLLWAHPARSCFVPSLEVTPYLPVTIAGWREDPENGCEFCALMDVEVIDPVTGETLYPMCVAVGNAVKGREQWPLGSRQTLAMAVLVEHLEVWPDLETYVREEICHPSPVRVGPGWFFPGGPYLAAGEPEFNPVSWFYGIAEQIRQRRNAITGETFWTAHVVCGDLAYRVVLDDQAGRQLTEGAVVYIRGWFCASN